MKANVLDKITRGLIYALVFFLPIFFLPISLDVLEMNKQTLLVILVFTASLSWIGSMLLRGTFSIRRGWINAFPLLLLLSVVISAFLSQGKFLSIVGTASQEYMSALTMLALCVLFFVVVNTIRSDKSRQIVLLLLMLSSALAGLIGATSLLGIPFLPFSFAKTQTFNTIGTLNALSMFLAVMTVIGSGIWIGLDEHSLLLPSGRLGTLGRATILLVSGITLFLLLTLDYWPLWLALLIGMGTLFSFVVLRAGQFKHTERFLLPFFISVVAILFLFWLPSPIPIDEPVEITPSFSLSWDIAKQTLADSSALFGSGPGTFMFSFSKYHGPELNQTAFWNVRFDRGASFALTTLTTLGVLGVFFWALFLIAIASRSLLYILRAKTRSQWMMGAVLFAGWLALLVSAFLYAWNMTLIFLMFLLSALLGGLVMSEEYRKPLKSSPRLAYVWSSTFVVVSIFLVFLIFVGGQRYLAEVEFSKAVRLDRQEADIDEVLTHLDRAASLVKYNDIYFRNLAEALLLRLSEEIQIIDPQKPLTEERGRYIQALTAASINAALRATELSPQNVQNWLVRAGVYRELIGTVSQSEEFAVASYQRAIELEPNNPENYTELGKTYLAIAESVRPQTESDDPATQADAQAVFEDNLLLA